VLRDGFSYAMQVISKPNDTTSNSQTAALNQIAQIKQIKVNTGRRSGVLVELLDTENQSIQSQLNHHFVANGGAFLADGDTVRVVAQPESASPESVAQ
ncbi:MAG: hypothetical protein V4605_04650, partial [Pseudomonadota bacterium]